MSLNELQQRIGFAQQAAYQVPDVVKQELARIDGLDMGHLTAFFLDPKQAEPAIARDFTAAQLGGQSLMTGYGQLDAAKLRNLADLGVTGQQAASGFGTLVHSRELFGSLPGENTTGIDEDQQLAAAFGGDAKAQEEISRRAAQRAGEFAGGGSFAGGTGGVSGAGSAQGA